MNWREWEPLYREILADFGFDRSRDEESARRLDGLLKGRPAPDLRPLLAGRRVAVCGKGPSLDQSIGTLAPGEVVVSANGATTRLLARGVVPAVVVTDLDGPIEDLLEANRRGAAMVVHAHGDNMERLPAVALMERVLGTTQAEPFGSLRNFGGFTDGDRCVFLARAHGAASVRLLGFDFDDPSVGPVKRKKLEWARKLLQGAGVV
jgi:uncharacterized Rossmann fold enzyme